jgi:sortase A
MPPKIYKKVYQKTFLANQSNKRISIAAVILMVLGSLLIGSVAGPIAAYFLIVSPKLNRNQTLLSPQPSEESIQNLLGQKVMAQEPKTIVNEDLRLLENWFPSSPPSMKRPSKITDYNLSIPKLGIDNAIVKIGGNDLAKSLIHYPGTANPGELGTPVIFGHSVLRQFYNPKNYVTIFSTIMTLRTGDRIIIQYDGVTYTYNVIDKFEVQPTDMEVLGQRLDGRFLKLITCVPEGTYLRRGIIVAQLI